MTHNAENFFKVRIKDRVDFAPDLWMIRVEPEQPFHFVAGQYATLGVETDHGLVERAYSIVSSPIERDLEFFFELVPNGALTPLLYKLGPGDILTARKVAKGRFTLDSTSGRTNHLLLATVTGVAPYVSFARTLANDANAALSAVHRLFILQGASISRELGYADELSRLAGSVPWLTYVPTVSRPWDDADWRGETGRVDELIRKYADQWGLDTTNTTAYLCGHPEMIEHGKAILRRRRWAPAALKEEVYFVKKSAASDE